MVPRTCCELSWRKLSNAVSATPTGVNWIIMKPHLTWNNSLPSSQSDVHIYQGAINHILPNVLFSIESAWNKCLCKSGVDHSWGIAGGRYDSFLLLSWLACLTDRNHVIGGPLDLATTKFGKCSCGKFNTCFQKIGFLRTKLKTPQFWGPYLPPYILHTLIIIVSRSVHTHILVRFIFCISGHGIFTWFFSMQQHCRCGWVI